ncbi:hypothetical protein ACTMTI_52035 [Nonomuraea sp. H19]|uniref:hypothetical protein n=1 Tax=Nonomuraea sp. H19 TaxID=3452206 RepID=UPI003F8B0BFB
MDFDELLRVALRSWPHDRGPGGWLHPYDDDRPDYLVWSVVEHVHARFEAPREEIEEYVPLLGMTLPRVTRMFRLRAYLVDLTSEWDLPTMKRVLLHQRPSPMTPWWFLRQASEEEIAAMEQYRAA